MARTLKVTTASKSKVITHTGFKNYDVCCNPYVGCQFGCSYCYVRFFVKDEEKPWGEFVRVREYIATRLPKELAANVGQRLVIGTMTDPYQPIEREHRITRTMLTIIDQSPHRLAKVGIFTRSPIIAEDAELIARLPKARVHYTISPYEDADIHKLEPIGIQLKRRFDTIKLLKSHGIRVHVSVAPAIPFLSETTTDKIAEALADAKVDEFFVDPMQAYGASFEAMRIALTGDPRWPQIEAAMKNPCAYLPWKDQYQQAWDAAWKKYGKDLPDTLPIWSDHESKVWVDMRTGQQMSLKHYGDDSP